MEYNRLSLINKSFNKKLIFFIILFIYLILYVLYNQTKKFSLTLIINNKKVNEDIDFISQNLNNYNYIINKYKREDIIWPLPKDIKFKPFMTEIEIKAFLYFMKPENIYFEFGSGGSTNLASYFKLKTYSVESDIKWHNKLKVNGINANYITVDLHASSIGYPGKDTNLNDWKKYIQAYKKEYNADIILIDGRFRIACALDIFPKIRNDTLIFIHDYENRKKYHVLERYYIKIKTWNSLALFLKNPNIESINKNIYNKYLKDKFI